MQTAFHKSVQDFIVNAFSVSVVRKMGPPGTLESVREFLKSLDLAAIGNTDPAQFCNTLNDLTEKLRRALPNGARHWGLARKCLNLFLRDALYNYYLREGYGLERFERYLEVPLDSYVGRGLLDEPEGERLPPWRTVKP